MFEHENSAAPHGDGDQGDHEQHHGGSIKTYMMVFGALCLLTTASFLTYTDFWRDHVPTQIGWAFMMAVSCTKAMLVILFFMHLLYEANWKYVLTIPCGFMSVFLACMLIPDVGLRMNRASEERLQHMATAEPHEAHAADDAAKEEGQQPSEDKK